MFLNPTLKSKPWAGGVTQEVEHLSNKREMKFKPQYHQKINKINPLA
jgi:hypothetical protein